MTRDKSINCKHVMSAVVVNESSQARVRVYQTTELPNVTVAIPCLNEEKSIRQCVKSLCASDYPGDQLEFIILDGMSTDGTRAILRALAAEDSRVKLVDNIGQGKPEAFNLALQHCKTPVILFAGAHAIYDKHYIRRLVQGMMDTGADNIGGVLTADSGSTPREWAISWATSSKVGAGNVPWRTGATELRQVESVFGGCFPVSVFGWAGNFNEQLQRCQDREFNFRLRRLGGKVYLHPGAEVRYLPRTRVLDHLRWTWSGSFWLFSSRRFTRTPMIKWRNCLPVALVLQHGLSVLLLLIRRRRGTAALAPIAMYWSFIAAAAISEGIRRKSVRFVPWGVLVVGSTHLTYGVAAVAGSMRALIPATRRSVLKRSQ